MSCNYTEYNILKIYIRLNSNKFTCIELITNLTKIACGNNESFHWKAKGGQISQPNREWGQVSFFTCYIQPSIWSSSAVTGIEEPCFHRILGTLKARCWWNITSFAIEWPDQNPQETKIPKSQTNALLKNN